MSAFSAQNIVQLWNSHIYSSQTKNIRNKKRKGIEDDFNKEESELNVKIEKLFELRQAAVAKLQNDAWEKLEALNEKLQFIEGSILTSMTNLEFATLNMTKQMILVLRKSIHNHQEINFGTVDNWKISSTAKASFIIARILTCSLAFIFAKSHSLALRLEIKRIMQLTNPQF